MMELLPGCQTGQPCSRRSLCCWTARQPLGQRTPADWAAPDDVERQLIHIYSVTPTAALQHLYMPAASSPVQSSLWTPGLCILAIWTSGTCRRRRRGSGTPSSVHTAWL